MSPLKSPFFFLLLCLHMYRLWRLYFLITKRAISCAMAILLTPPSICHYQVDCRKQITFEFPFFFSNKRDPRIYTREAMHACLFTLATPSYYILHVPGALLILAFYPCKWGEPGPNSISAWYHSPARTFLFYSTFAVCFLGVLLESVERLRARGGSDIIYLGCSR
jgi:hypothetical protein